ncbi:MAG: amidohydrolase family protein [Actinomycetota bacterium]|nr:amidohydrolase family protein [Actinomycetota bacterium]
MVDRSSLLEDPMAEYTAFETYTDYGIFDCDQHIYEPIDCYTGWIEQKYADRTLRIVERDGESLFMAQDRPIQLDNKVDECYRPGSLKEMLKTMKSGGDGGGYQWMSMDPAFLDRDLRLAQMDRQHVDAAVMFCGSMGLFAEHFLTDDEVYWASSWAYLRWMDEVWGFGADGRIFTSPVVSMRDLTKVCEQLDWLFERGCKAISICPGPAYGRSPGDPYFDPFWARIEAAGAVVCYHINEALPGFKASRSHMWGQEEYPTFYTQSAWQWAWAYGEQPAMETFSAMIYDNLFARFPGLRILSAEHGAEWVPGLMRKMDKMRGMGRNGPWIGGQLTERPSTIFQRHFRVVPYWEDDLAPVFAATGTDVVVGGSDFPHSEGLAFPTQLVDHLGMLDHQQQRFVMRDNAMQIFGLA